MKISKAIVKDGIMKQPVTIELNAVVEKMKSKTLLEVKETPQLLVSATFGRGGLGDVRTMTGLLVLHAESCRRQLVRQWQQAVMRVPYTLLAWKTRDHRELYIVREFDVSLTQ